MSISTKGIAVGRKQKGSALDVVFETLKLAPFWVGPVLAAVVFAFIRFVVPLFFQSPKTGTFDVAVLLRQMVPMFSWLIAGAVLLAWVMAEIWKLMNRRLLNRQTGLASLNDMSWRNFERLVSEAYHRKGYMAEVVGADSGDGGVDIRLIGIGETVLVQCKQWKAFKVGVTTVRELLGVVVSEKADRGIVVTSGRFTQEAATFARQNRQIELVDGPELAELIRGVQAGAIAPPPRTPVPMAIGAAPACPLCGSKLVLRTARKGQNAGSQFWGCPKYPGCRGWR
ncbi:MAG: restriction endonuclease [Phycisphaerae bacterium]